MVKLAKQEEISIYSLFIGEDTAQYPCFTIIESDGCHDEQEKLEHFK